MRPLPLLFVTDADLTTSPLPCVISFLFSSADDALATLKPQHCLLLFSSRTPSTRGRPKSPPPPSSVPQHRLLYPSLVFTASLPFLQWITAKLKNPYKDLDDGRQRFLLELEFVQCLANPTYIHYDEYATASENDPKILLTTSRELSQHLGQFVKVCFCTLPIVIFHLVMFRRSIKALSVISEIIEFCRAHEYIDVIFVHEHRGEPDNLVICHLPFGPTAFFELLNVV
ncbi:hypothetical protein ZIOFF_001626 [Zingiber officinale]|uniref:Mediator of RNA polymerase II transcription subunit 31 n=1 Tax=Zingiber officinale TaxID=94328 RepID=A0A8J5LV62_ZINOF|nr:hypothetical protein ZIOFF_001626 [Zingiber officinale]